MARPNPPGVSSTPSGRGFLFLLQTLRGARHLSRRKRVGRRREASEERRRARTGQGAPARRAGAERPGLALIKRPFEGGAGHDPRGGRSRYISTAPPPESRSRCTKGGRSRSVSRPTPSSRGGPVKVYRDRPPRVSRPAPPPPRSDSFI